MVATGGTRRVDRHPFGSRLLGLEIGWICDDDGWRMPCERMIWWWELEVTDQMRHWDEFGDELLKRDEIGFMVGVEGRSAGTNLRGITGRRRLGLGDEEAWRRSNGGILMLSAAALRVKFGSSRWTAEKYLRQSNGQSLRTMASARTYVRALVAPLSIFLLFDSSP